MSWFSCQNILLQYIPTPKCLLIRGKQFLPKADLWLRGQQFVPYFVCFFTLYLPRKMGGGNCFPSGCTGRIKATSTQAHNLLNASSLQHERKKQSKFHVLKTTTPFFLLASDKGGVSILSQRTPHTAIVLLIQATFSFT